MSCWCLLDQRSSILVRLGGSQSPTHTRMHSTYIGELSPHAQKLNSTGMNSSVLSCIKDNYSRMWSTFVKLRQPRPRGILSTASIQYAWHVVCMYFINRRYELPASFPALTCCPIPSFRLWRMYLSTSRIGRYAIVQVDFFILHHEKQTSVLLPCANKNI